MNAACFAIKRRVSICLVALLAASFTSADDWPHWRGLNRNGVIQDPSGWNGSSWVNPKPAWETDVGEGASSPLLVGGHVYALGHQDGRNIVSCLDAETGGTVWEKSYKTSNYGRNAIGDEGLYSGPSSTPEFDPATHLLYTLSSDGDLHCWNCQQDGLAVWHRNLYDDYDMPRRAKVGRSGRRDYGYTSSPLIYRDWVLVEAGGPAGTIVAFEKLSGKEVWRSEAKSVAGHTGGMSLITVEGIDCIAAMTFDGLLVLRMDAGNTGKTVATYPWITDFANNVASPAVHEDCVLITSAYNKQSICKLKITLTGAQKLWDQPFASKACTPVIHRGRIYLAWGKLRCLDWMTGKLVWEGPPVGDAGSIVATSDTRLVVWAGRGDLILGNASASMNPTFQELSRVSRLAKDDVWPHVVVANHQILCRDRHGRLLSFTLP